MTASPAAQPMLSARASKYRLTQPTAASKFRELELQGILRILNSKRAILPGIAAFEIAAVRDDPYHRRYHTQVRTIPLFGAERVEFRYDMKLADSGAGSFEDIAWDVLGSAYRFMKPNLHAPLGELAREMVEPIVAEADEGLIPPRLVAVGVAFDFVRADPQLTVDLEMLGDDLVLGIERVTGRDIDHIVKEVSRYVETHRQREEARADARGACAAGWINQAALRIIDAAGLERRTTIELICRNGEVAFSFGGLQGDEFRAGLRQTNGVIKGSIIPRDRRWCLKPEDLIIWGAGLPEVISASLEGRRIGELFQNGELPQDAVITGVEDAYSVDPEVDDDEIDGWLRLTIDIPLVEIDEATGNAREADGALAQAVRDERRYGRLGS